MSASEKTIEHIPTNDIVPVRFYNDTQLTEMTNSNRDGIMTGCPSTPNHFQGDHDQQLLRNILRKVEQKGLRNALKEISNRIEENALKVYHENVKGGYQNCENNHPVPLLPLVPF